MTQNQIDDILQSAESDEQHAPTFDYPLLRKAVNDIAKQQSIAFAEWIDGCGYSRIPLEDRYAEWTEGNEIVAHTTDQLYTLFIEASTKQP